jgi:transposase InsO family protein
MSDSLADGRRFRLLTIVDTMTRERPAIAVSRSFSGQAVAEVLERLAQTTGLPKMIQVDNGPEFVSKALDAWAHRRQVKLVFSRLGTRPTTRSLKRSMVAFGRSVWTKTGLSRSRMPAPSSKLGAWTIIRFDRTRPWVISRQLPTRSIGCNSSICPNIATIAPGPVSNYLKISVPHLYSPKRL